MARSQTIEQTRLWQVYEEKNKSDLVRIAWTKAVCEAACEQLKAVRDTFSNYTLHDETHVLNVLDAMSGLLGNQIETLTEGETELLLLAAALHDLGMVYTDDERIRCLADKTMQRAFYNYRPSLRGTDPDDWNDSVRQDYLRWLHPFRVWDVLQQPNWQQRISNQPKEVVPIDVIVSVCRAHGETPSELRCAATELNGGLRFRRFMDVDPLFCAILLRLADILDFDDSRVPSVLFSYSTRSEKSVTEWKKHMGSMGFRYPDTPSTADLPYGAVFTDPTIERSARTFLDWIDDEFSNVRGLLPFTCNRWKNFPFPYQVDRSEIERNGYDFGDFHLSMDQEQIMELLIGENLYPDRSVFVRELLQNSIDATLLRAKMDSTFEKKLATDEARIDIWEWWDENGELWFRIDDNGTGMTRGMLEKYFLKAGNSYYNSQELKRDLQGKQYFSISRFGIGFLSCFLCGIEAYVSTTYWNKEKNLSEAEQDSDMCVDQNLFGLRLDVTGLTGYYTLRNQAIFDNRPAPFPSPPVTIPHPDADCEKAGYRTCPGTSIAIRIDPGKLGSRSLMMVAKEWACFPRMPIYYNGNRLCLTHDELIALAKREQGVREYELTGAEKKQFDTFLPELVGKYPKIKETIVLFEAGRVPDLPQLAILLCETKVLLPTDKRIHRNGYYYAYTGASSLHKPAIRVHNAGQDNEDLILSFQSKDNRQLFDVLLDYKRLASSMHYGWKGVFAYHDGIFLHNNSPAVIVLDEDDERPDMKASRINDVRLPLKNSITVLSWLDKHILDQGYPIKGIELYNMPLKEWRRIITVDFRRWLDLSSWDKYQAFKKALETGIASNNKLPKILSAHYDDMNRYWKGWIDDIRWLFLADLQLHYRIVVNYSNQKLDFIELDSVNEDTRFDLFPPMPFCYGKTEADCSVLCAADPNMRLAITANHPFTKWLLDNAEMLLKHYTRQFEQIILGIQNKRTEELIDHINEIIEQISKGAFRYGIDISSCPKLTISDFWIP